MSKHATCGTLVISIAADATSAGPGLLPEDAALATIDGLLRLLRNARMAATWISRAPAASKAITEVLAEAIEHEVALQMPCNPGGGSLPARATSELMRQQHAAQQAGYTITTLACKSTPSVEMLEHARRLGLTAVATTAASESRSSSWFTRIQRWVSWGSHEPPQPRLLRYGLWETPPALPLVSHFARRALQECAACGDILHVNVDATQHHGGRAGGLRRVEAFLQQAFDLRSEHRLAICTVADLTKRLSSDRTSPPAQSILRRAA